MDGRGSCEIAALGLQSENDRRDGGGEEEAAIIVCVLARGRELIAGSRDGIVVIEERDGL